MLTIYLADLVYDTIKTNYSVPLNIAYLAAYLQEKFPGVVKISLFKFPTALEQAIRESPPDILGLSHYSWNSRLGFTFLDMVKRINPRAVTVMGGPNVRADKDDLQKFLIQHANLDYHILYDGEEPMGDLVHGLLDGNPRPTVAGAATLIDGELVFSPLDYNSKGKLNDLPSPYLSGWLDPFIKDPNMFPIFETNRGCPFGCVYCCWGVESRAKVRLRPLEMVYEEINYVAENSAGQLYWYFCDGNFGLFPRDIDISRKIRDVMDKKGFPTKVEIFHSKNTGDRNMVIAEILGPKSKGYLAIQSADPAVLAHSGRGNINMGEIQKQIRYYQERNLEIRTDVLVGLPSETAESHLNTLIAAFDMGFDIIDPVNIRLLPGSKYESEEYRRKYGVITKYRPIFGSYGIYDGRLTFELEESLRATKDMSEKELNDFKVIHWLIYFAWNMGIFKPVLKFGKKRGINPARVLYKLEHTAQPTLKLLFDRMRDESMKEWFKTPDEMILFYTERKNFDTMVNGFVKLNFSYLAAVYQKPEIVQLLQDALIEILKQQLPGDEAHERAILEEVAQLSERLVCKDLLQKSTNFVHRYSREAAAIVVDIPQDFKDPTVPLEIYRPEEFVAFCRSQLDKNGKKDLSLSNLTRFLEVGGIEFLRNRIRIVE